MKAIAPLLIASALVVLCGCATSTIEKRRAERAVAYEQLSPDEKSRVDGGDIQVGMSEDAVYIAWGKADQVLHSGDKGGRRTTWLYEGTTTDTHYRWIAFPATLPDGTRVLERHLSPRTQFRDYVAAELVFKEGKLEKWKTNRRPPSRTIHRDGGYFR